jgi:hypothetical protein
MIASYENDLKLKGRWNKAVKWYHEDMRPMQNW